MRLAAYVVHHAEVDAVMDSMTHEQFDEWCAYDMIEPIGTQPICEVLTSIGLLVSAALGVTSKVKHFMPWREVDEVKPQAASPNQVRQMLRGKRRG